jgi:hypothetical protein
MRNRPQVVITRKDKRVNHKVAHLAAFAITGGLSGFVTAGEVTSHAGYNARTRVLQAQSEGARALTLRTLIPPRTSVRSTFRQARSIATRTSPQRRHRGVVILPDLS